MDAERTSEGYRDLDAWEVGATLTEEIYELIDELSRSDRWTWGDQLKRSAIGITGNIAEGYGTGTRANFRRYVRLARGSAMETESHLRVMQRLDLAPESSMLRCLKLVERVIQLTTGLERYLDQQIQRAS